MRAFIGPAAILVALAVAGPVLAQDECVVVPASPEINARGFYVDNVLCQPGCVVAAFVYEESNGIGGLQRRDSFADDTCGAIEPDMLVMEVVARP